MTASGWSWRTPAAWTPRSRSGGWRRPRATRSSPARSTSARRPRASSTASASAASTAAPSRRSWSTPRTSSPTSSWRPRSPRTRMYMGKYPLVSALSRPLITRHLVRVARETGAAAIGHGCTGKGNDQVRFEVTAMAIAPDLTVEAPIREWGLSRDASIAWANERGIPIPVKKASPVLDRREPVGPHRRVRDPRGPLGVAARGGLRALALRWPTPPTSPRSWCSPSSAACRSPSTARSCRSRS